VTRRRGFAVAVLTALALVLAGCAGLPTAGPVNPGLGAGAEAGDPAFAFRPDSPQPGATPEEIVDGFIRAGTGPGADGTWSVAREYLAPSAESKWDPTAEVTIDEPGDRVFSSTADDEVSLSLTRVADVDAIGAYEPADAASIMLNFRLAVQSDGEWRITEAPDGLILDTSEFSSVFRRYALMYFDPTWQFLVPDVRWFPANNAATHIADALVEGPPAPWLAASVGSAFPASLTLRPSVPVDDDGVAHVEFDSAAVDLSTDVLSRMEAQLEASLSTANVTAVEMSAGTTPLDVEPAPTRSTRVSALPLVLTTDGFGFLAGDQLETIDGLSAAMAGVDPVSIQLSPDRDFAAVRTAAGTGARVETSGDVLEFDTRPGLIDPTLDPSGYIWSVPRDTPAQLAAFAPGSERIDIQNAWPDATRVSAMAVSRDGTRLAAAVTSGGRPAIWISGIIRTKDGVPSALGTPLIVQVLTGEGTGIAWLDDTTVAVLSPVGDEPEVVELVVGGPATTTAAPAGSAQVAGASQGAVRVRGADGALFAKRGSTWPQTASGILVLATQQGVPR
jgi:hypothetical protein